MTAFCMFLSSPFFIPKAPIFTQPATGPRRIRCSPSGLGPLEVSTPNMKLTVVETHNITSVPNTTTTDLPLTFLDVFWIPFKTQVIFFYSIPSITTQHFLTSLLPNLKTSLSTSLQLFFPLTGIFTPPTNPSSKPFIHCSNDSFVPLVIAEEEAAARGRSCFDHLIGKDKTRPINDTEFYPLVPDLVKDELTGSSWSSVLALQVTVFPDCGICFGVTFKHVVADGKSIAAFLHTWASICKNNCIMLENTIMPIFDRSLIPDPNGTILNTCLKQFFALKSSADSTEDVASSTQVESEVKVRGTFVVTKSEIQNMKVWILKHVGNEDLHISTFVLACSLIWVSLIKSAKVIRKSDVCPTDLSYFGQAVDCRDRYEFKSIVPLAYFGNCLGCGCNAQAKTTDLKSEDGIVVAVKAIGNRIKRLQLDGALDVESWIPDFFEISKTGNIVTVAGSPRLDLYGLDFGWGRPVKVEFVSIGGGAISIAEHVGDEGGVEVGLALGIDQMEAFASILDESKCKYCGPC